MRNSYLGFMIEWLKEMRALFWRQDMGLQANAWPCCCLLWYRSDALHSQSGFVHFPFTQLGYWGNFCTGPGVLPSGQTWWRSATHRLGSFVCFTQLVSLLQNEASSKQDECLSCYIAWLFWLVSIWLDRPISSPVFIIAFGTINPLQAPKVLLAASEGETLGVKVNVAQVFLCTLCLCRRKEKSDPWRISTSCNKQHLFWCLYSFGGF